MAFSFFKGRTTIECNSTITNTSINMSGKILTGLLDPVNITDAVSLGYLTSNVISSKFILSSTNYTIISTKTIGSFDVNVCHESLGPSASFTISKGSSSKYPSLYRKTSSAGSVTNERLTLKWDPGEGIKIKKNGVNYDGNYSILLTGV